MGKQIEKLTALQVKAFDKRGGRLSDGGKLYVVCSKTGGSKSWSFIYDYGGRQRTKGLGSVDIVSLKQARAKAAECRQQLDKGLDPISVAHAAKRAESVPTFEAAAKVFLDKKTGEWRSDKVKHQARMVLAQYAKSLHKLPVDQIDTQDVLKVLQPIWARAPVVGARLRGYIEATLNGAKALGHINPDKANCARWRGHLDQLLPKRPQSAHHAAMDYARVPAFVAELRRMRFAEDGSICIPAFALEFAVLTATRAGETLRCRWQEIDTDVKLWRIPEERMKSRKAFTVPLSDAALAVIEAMLSVRVEGCDLVFPGRFKYRPLLSKAFERLLASMKETVTSHGFRSSFRDFSGNETATPRDICEMALAHKVGDSTERAYRRDDALTKRRELMNLWAAHLSPPPADDKVITLRRA
jgi:integrase